MKENNSSISFNINSHFFQNNCFSSNQGTNSSFVNCEIFFKGYNNYNIHTTLAFFLKYDKYIKRKATLKDFYEFAEERNNKYIIIDKFRGNKDLLDLIEYDKLVKGKLVYNYKVINKGDDFAILELNNNQKLF